MASGLGANEPDRAYTETTNTPGSSQDNPNSDRFRETSGLGIGTSQG